MLEKLFVLGSSVLFLSSCAMMSEQQCANANWTAIGQKDGFSGGASLLQSRSQACAKHQIHIQKEHYLSGYHAGLKQYCTPRTVFDDALHGQKGSYQNCPLDMQNQLRPYYNVANTYFVANAELKSLEENIVTAKTKLNNADLKPETRAHYREQLIEFKYKMEAAQREYYRAERDLENFKRIHKFY